MASPLPSEPRPALEDALVKSGPACTGELYAVAASYRELAREAITQLHIERTRVTLLETQLSQLRVELRLLRGSDAA